ncbi:hypothetical protein, partial [Neisseria sicca]|uniref:hypothetical protein n=1 Tax=Neisseria sicca TaxID=490 RepID=UPI0011BCFE39
MFGLRVGLRLRVRFGFLVGVEDLRVSLVFLGVGGGFEGVGGVLIEKIEDGGDQGGREEEGEEKGEKGFGVLSVVIH